MNGNNTYHFPEITLLITHYNRSKSLEKLLSGFSKLDIHFAEIIVSDDGSNDNHKACLLAIQREYSFKLIETPLNRGLGNNINKGQAAVQTEFLLYVQEDFQPLQKLGPNLLFGLHELKERIDLDIIRFYAYSKYPYLQPYRHGFSEIAIPSPAWRYTKIYAYSDHPHLRRSSFSRKFGTFKEGEKGDRTEYRMCVSFIKQGGKGLFFNEYKELFDQVNTDEEPSTMVRSHWRAGNSPLIRILRNAYRQLKYNFDLTF